ncbi:MAG: DUF559 domain-containing protein [Chitinophagales bacterium]
MEFNFSEIEKRAKEIWAGQQVFRTALDTSKPKYYVLDMFPYPSGAGLHVGHPLGYISSDIIARYKRLKGFNVLHPMGYDSFGLPAEQYAIQTGQHPAITTEQNINTFRGQMDKLGFSFDWSREVRTSDPKFYKWTQWIFIQLFHSWYNSKTDRAEEIDTLISQFVQNGTADLLPDESKKKFNAAEWNTFSEKEQSDILLQYRLTYIDDSWVNWCPALGTVLANDEVKDGVSERGGYPVERKLMKQWSQRITAYADRLLKGLDEIDWSESIKEAQRNWIGKSEGCSVRFKVSAEDSPILGRAAGGKDFKTPNFLTANPKMSSYLQKEGAKGRKQPTEAEELLWERLRNRKLGEKFRRQHPVDNFIPDFVCLSKKLIVEVDGGYHMEEAEYDLERTKILNGLGYEVVRFNNEEVMEKINEVIVKIKMMLKSRDNILTPNPSPKERGTASSFDEALYSIEVFTTRPDTIFGVSFITLAPEHELVNKITTEEYASAVNEYVAYATNRSERDRMADVKKITGQFTGAYVLHPFTGSKIPVWIGDYVLATYGTGAVMAVPGHDIRDYAFAKFFEKELTKQLGHSPIVEVIIGGDLSKEAYVAKEGVCVNSDFLNGLQVKDAIRKAIEEIEEEEIGEGKINFRLRDAIFGRQRYWGEPIPIYYGEEGIPYTVDEQDLPLVLPRIDKYLPTETGEPPLARAEKWWYVPKSSPSLTLPKGERTLPGKDNTEASIGLDNSRYYQTSNKHLYGLLKERAKDLRREMTKAEEIVWEMLRTHGAGLHFRRQRIIGNYIVDFVCLSKQLIVEIDGEIHKYQKEEDEAREFELQKLGFSIIRFSNEEVINNKELVLEKIKKAIDADHPPTGQKEKGPGAGKVSPLGGDLEGASIPMKSYPLELTTMPGWAGSCWYYLRYEDPNNENTFASKEAINYWQNIDFYIGGDEHATGHLLYFRFWTKFLFDRGWIPFEEPAKKLLNQGKIQGVSALIYKLSCIMKFNDSGKVKRDIRSIPTVYISKEYKDKIDSKTLSNEEENRILECIKNANVNIRNKYPNQDGSFFWSKPYYGYEYVNINHIIGFDHLNTDTLKNESSYSDDIFIKELNGFVCERIIEKMSKSKYNVINPDDVVGEYGADAFRMYEMFLGPIEQHKPWDTKGIDGVYRFLKKMWKLFYDENGSWIVNSEAPTNEELKIIYRTIKKVADDVERLSFNTSISAFMICVNELTQLNSHKKEVLESLLIILSPYAPFVTEYLWEQMGNKTSIVHATFPSYDESLLVENAFEYPVAVNGKTRIKMNFALDTATDLIEKEVMNHEGLQKYFDGKTPKKVIVVKGRMINVVV